MSRQTFESEVPAPRRRLWRTRWKWRRNVTPLAPPIPIGDVLSPRPADEEIAHWGQYGLLEDFATVLHRDGTPTYRRRWVLILHSVQEIATWEYFEYRFDRRSWKYTIPRARVVLPGGQERRARITNRATDKWGFGRLVTVGFARLAPGVVVEMEDQQDNFTPYSECPGVWGDYALQTAYPCRRRCITLAVAQPFTARFELHNGATSPAERQVGEYRVWTWDLRDVPGIEWDPHTPPLYEFAPWVDFSTLPTWKPVARYYLQQLNVPENPDVKNMVATLAAKREGTENRAMAAYHYAARDVRYGRPREYSNDWAIRPLGAVAEELRGDCKDKSALLVALLRSLDIDARVALVRTAQVGRVALLPGARFNHSVVLAKVDGRELWLDPAGAGCSWGDLPSYDQGAQALILDRREPQVAMIPAPSSRDHRVERVVRGRLEADGSYRAEVRLLVRGDRAASWRWGLMERNAAMRERVLRQYVGASFPGADLTDFGVERLDDLSGDLGIAHGVAMQRLARRVQNLLLLRIPWFETLHDTGFFAASSRPQPLLVPIQSVSERQEIGLPPGFSGYGLPIERVEECTWGRYRCVIRFDDGALQCERDFELLGGLVPPERYEEVKRFTDAGIEADASDVVVMGADLKEESADGLKSGPAATLEPRTT